MYKGIAASPGLAIGQVFIIRRAEANLTERGLQPEEVPAELKRLNNALAQSKREIEELGQEVARNIGHEQAAIFEAHAMVLEDPALAGEIRSKIENGLCGAETATRLVVESVAAAFLALEDEYFSARAADVRDVGSRVLRHLTGQVLPLIDQIPAEAIIVAEDLTPSETATLPRDRVRAFVTEAGGKTSHSAIMARSMGIPAVVGLGSIVAEVRNGDVIVVDGDTGEVLINAAGEVLETYRQGMESQRLEKLRLDQLRELPASTIDGRRISVAANIGGPGEVKGILANGAEEIGLYRTEFLFMDRPELPSEEDQFEAYRAVVEEMAGRPVTIRTLDFGGDKAVPYLDMPTEANPFLGWRALRICLDRVDIFKTQLRAILRASAFGNVRIMFPMVASVEEVRRAKDIVGEVRTELRAEGIGFSEAVEIGIMVETPAAAAIADLLAPEVDFFSIGTNDLTQYTLAVDRINARVAHLYDYFQPGVVRLIAEVIRAGHAAGIWVGMCGEMAGDPAATPLLLGFGLDEFSMSASSIPRVKETVRSLSLSQCRETAEMALKRPTASEIREFIRSAAAYQAAT